MKSEDRKPAMVVHTYNPSMEKSGAGRLSAWLKQNPISKEENKNNKQKNQMGKKKSPQN